MRDPSTLDTVFVIRISDVEMTAMNRNGLGFETMRALIADQTVHELRRMAKEKKAVGRRFDLNG
jgi:hypothetical protein